MPKEKQIKKNTSSQDTDHFRKLVQDCVNAYEKLNNDSLALDFCKVADKRLRAMILGDEYYQMETKSIYARQRLEEIEELDNISESISFDDDKKDNTEGEFIHPSERGRRDAGKEFTNVDRDLLTMRLKTAQLKRELMAEMANSIANTELDVVCLMFVDTSAEDYKTLETFELSEGSNEADLEALVGKKEEIPVGTSGKQRIKSKTKAVEDDYFDVMPNGEVVEK